MFIVKLRTKLDGPDVAKLLLDLADSFEVGRTVKRIATHEQEFDEVACDVSASNIKSSS